MILSEVEETYLEEELDKVTSKSVMKVIMINQNPYLRFIFFI